MKKRLRDPMNTPLLEGSGTPSRAQQRASHSNSGVSPGGHASAGRHEQVVGSPQGAASLSQLASARNGSFGDAFGLGICGGGSYRKSKPTDNSKGEHPEYPQRMESGGSGNGSTSERGGQTTGVHQDLDGDLRLRDTGAHERIRRSASASHTESQFIEDERRELMEALSIQATNEAKDEREGSVFVVDMFGCKGAVKQQHVPTPPSASRIAENFQRYSSMSNCTARRYYSSTKVAPCSTDSIPLLSEGPLGSPGSFPQLRVNSFDRSSQAERTFSDGAEQADTAALYAIDGVEGIGRSSLGTGSSLYRTPSMVHPEAHQDTSGPTSTVKFSLNRKLSSPIPPPGGSDPPATGSGRSVWRRSRSKSSGWLTKQRKFTVLEIGRGKCKRHDLQTPELLRMVHYHNKHGRLEDTVRGSLKLRDLRQVCSHGSSAGHRPSIEARRNCILINLPPVRCLILHDRVLMIPFGQTSPTLHHQSNSPHSHFDATPNAGKGVDCGALTFPSGYGAREYSVSRHMPTPGHCSGTSVPSYPYTPGVLRYGRGGQLGDTEELPALISNLVHLSELRTTGPFEFAALEAVLIDVCNRLDDEFTPLKRHAQHILDVVNKVPSSTRLLHEITDLRRTVDTVNDRILGVKAALKEILDNEEDIQRLEISRFWEQPEEWDHPGESGVTDDVEILLECYEQEAESILKQCNRTDENLDDALQIMELHLASVRNVFLKSELGLDIVGVVITFVGAVAGIFGMNIRNGYEDDRDVFWPITMVMISLCAIAGIFVLVLFRRLKL